MSASQADLWSGPVGDSWVRNASAYDRALEPLGRAALDLLELKPALRVLDVGCGTGTTTFEIARRLHPGGSVIGVDVSHPMIEYARTRVPDAVDGASVEFAVLDVETDELSGPFDAAFSRLGVMFFDRPAVAFANIASSLIAGGCLAFVCLKSPAENPFISVPVGAALTVLNGPGMPPRGSAGPFSLADPDRVRELLELRVSSPSSWPPDLTRSPWVQLPSSTLWRGRPWSRTPWSCRCLSRIRRPARRRSRQPPRRCVSTFMTVRFVWAPRPGSLRPASRTGHNPTGRPIAGSL